MVSGVVLGPWIVRFFASASGPLVSVMVFGVIGGGGDLGGFPCPLPEPLPLAESDTRGERSAVAELNSEEENTMVSPLAAAVIVARREPAPLS